MDKFKSLELEKELKNKSLDGFKVVKYLNNGKSAAVFEAEKNKVSYALKIFDNDLVDMVGHEIQSKRIEQEIALKEHDIKGLVRIYSGGVTQVEGQDYYYLIMEFIDGLNLKEFIEEKGYDLKFIQKVLKQLIETTEELIDKKGIVHRDIKPENIMVDAQGDIILMDLGVLKLIGKESFSDQTKKEFLGTLRYAPPEFLLREEQDSIHGWRAVNYYQIGGTLHDLIMKKELFEDKHPYSVLIVAILNENPNIQSDEYPYELVKIVRAMLSKKWKQRITLVNKEKIEKVISILDEITDDYEISIEQLNKKRLKYESEFEYIKSLVETEEQKQRKRSEAIINIKKEVKTCFFSLKNEGIYDNIHFFDSFLISNDKTESDKAIINFFCVMTATLKKGFSHPLYSLIRIECDEFFNAKIETVFVIVNNPTINVNQFDSKMFFRDAIGIKPTIGEIVNRVGKIPISNQFERIEIFNGVAVLDESFQKEMKLKLLKPILKAIDFMEPEIEMKIAQKKHQLETKRNSITERVINQPYIVINKL